MSETGVNLFDYVNSKEVFVQSVYMSKCLINKHELSVILVGLNIFGMNAREPKPS